ncbi:hypothetical protein RYX36_025515 [Vicia faba]
MIMGKAGIDDLLEYPISLDYLIEKKMVFKVKWQPKWKTTSVVYVILDEETVKLGLSKLDENQKPTSTGVSDINSNHVNDPNSSHVTEMTSSHVDEMNSSHVNNPSSFQIKESVDEKTDGEEFNMLNVS